MGGAGGGNGQVPLVFVTSTLDSTASDLAFIDMTVDATLSRAGIAYFVGTADAGGYDLKYLEVSNGVAGTPELIDHVVDIEGLSIDFDPVTGEPTVAYLGGGSDGSLIWTNTDAEIAFRTAGTWAKEAAVTDSATVTCGAPTSPSNFGTVVGLWPAVKHDSKSKVWLCYRDVHGGGGYVDAGFIDAGTVPVDAGTIEDAGVSDAGGSDDAGGLDDAGVSDDAGVPDDDGGTTADAGADAGGPLDAGASVPDAGKPFDAGTPQSRDYAGSDVKCVSGSSGSWVGECAKPGGNSSKDGAGPDMHMAMAGDLPVIAFDHDTTGPGGMGANVTVDQRNMLGWQAQDVLDTALTQLSLAADSSGSLFVAAFDGSAGTLQYRTRPSGGTWSASEVVFSTGTGGSSPSISIAPTSHAPSVAYFVCSTKPGITPDKCDTHELRLSVRSPSWESYLVDAAGGAQIHSGSFASGKRIITYRDPTTGALKMALSN
jgi:hypothetical protein